MNEREPAIDARRSDVRSRLRIAIPVGVAVTAMAVGGVAAGVAGVGGGGQEVDDGAPSARSAAMVVASGRTVNGSAWQLSAYDSERGPCLRLALGRNARASEACGTPSGIGYVTLDDLEAGERLVFGAAGGDVARVRVADERGHTVTAGTATTPGGGRAYLASLPDSDGALEVDLTAEADDGRVVARERAAFAARRRPLSAP